MSQISPFTTSRFEYERHHVYFLPRRILKEIEEAKPLYLVGSRGTGKTTLLKALTWKERLSNASLRQQLGQHPFRAGYIGVYVKAPEYQMQAFDHWLRDSSDEIYGSVTTYFFDLLWTALFAEAVSGLIAAKVLSVAPEFEHLQMAKLREEMHDSFASRLPATGRVTVRDLESACQREACDWQTMAKLCPPLGTVLRKAPTGQCGIFGRVAACRLAQICDSDATESRWHFKACIDESETLPLRQQLALNTTVRLSQWPMFPVLSFVSMPSEMSRTLVPALSLGQADRNLRVIDEVSDAEFAELATGVTQVRVSYVLRRSRCEVDLHRMLGPWSVNSQLETLLRSSATENAAKLLASAQALLQHPFFQVVSTSHSDLTAESDETESEAVLPIYQAYLISKLGLTLPSPDDPLWKRRAQDSAELRKRMVAAYLGVCAEMKMDVRYGGADVVLQLSDKCTRDLLSQMEAVFHASGKTLAQFMCTQTPFHVQHTALRKASEDKSKALIRFGVRTPTNAERLIHCLAVLTAQLQSTSRNCDHLRSSERGLFELSLQEGSAQRHCDLYRLILDAGEAGFLRISPPDGSSVRFRVHTSLAAAYQFSYRGAYYPVRLTWSEVQALVDASTEAAQSKAIDQIIKRISGEEDRQLPLLPGFESQASV